MLRAGKDAESTSSVQMAEAWVDPRLRLAEEPKTPSSKGHTFAGAGGSVCSRRECLMLTALFVLAYLSGAEEIIFAYFTTLRCEPAIIRAGTNVTCEMSTSAYSREYDLSISQRGGAGPIELLASEPHWYRVTFATGTAGAAGLRARHAIFWTSSWVEVVAGPAVSAAVECGPPRVAPGAKVHCMVTTRDAHGNLAEVEKPADAPANFFSISPIGSARDLAIHDTHVEFVAGAAGEAANNDAGLALVLDGMRVESRVQVSTSTSSSVT